MAKLLLSLALAASCTASVLRRNPEPAPKGWLTLPISYRQNSAPLRKRDQDVPLFNVTSVSYLVELSIGTPGQSVKVAIDTGSDELWVNPNCRSSGLSVDQARECTADGQYKPGSSSTAEELSDTNTIQYGKGKVAMQYYTDNIALPESTINVTSAQFGVATNTQDLNEGILGLGWGKGFNLDYDNFIDALAEQKVTKSRAFSVALGSVNANNGGVLIFGGVDTKKFTGPLVSNKILGPQGRETLNRYWIQMSSIALSKSGSSSKTYSGTSMAIVLDSGSSLSYLPSDVVTAIASDFNAQLDSSGFYLVPCSQTKTQGSLDFTFGQATIKVPFSDFIWQFSDTQCILGAMPIQKGSAITALLGDTFMRSAFTVFDQTTETISLAQYVNCGEHEQVIPAGGVGNFTGECQGAQAKQDAAGRFTFSVTAVALAAVAGLAVAL